MKIKKIMVKLNKKMIINQKKKELLIIILQKKLELKMMEIRTL